MTDDDDSEQAWGNSVPTPAPSVPPAAKPIPNQRSMPVVGRSTPPAQSQPHVDYQQQAAQHFGHAPVTPPPAALPYPVSYPVIPQTASPSAPPVGYPVHPPAGYPPMAQPTPNPSQLHSSYPPAIARDSFVTRLMDRGVKGALITQPWFLAQRQRNADLFVYISYGIGVFVSIVVSFIPSSFVVTVFTAAIWAGLGIVYFAIGTKLAHQFILFGICLVGGLVMALRVLLTIAALSASRWYGSYYEPPIVQVMVLLISLAVGAALVYIGIQVHRGIQRMSAP